MRPLGWAVALLVIASPALLLSSSYNFGRVEVILLYGIAVLPLNLSLGYGGQYILGQIVVIGSCAYVAGLMSVHWQSDMQTTLIPTVVVGILVGVLIALPGLRLKGWTLAFTGFIAVLAFGPTVQLGVAWTGGEDGLVGVLPPAVFGSKLGHPMLYLIVAGTAVLCWVAIRQLVLSPVGLRLLALRDAPKAAESVGLSLVRTKFLVFVLSSIPAALAGWLFVHVNQFAAPGQFGFVLLTILFAALLVGGRGTLWGPVVGTAIVGGFTFLVGPFSSWNQLLLGLAIVIVVTTFPAGVAPALSTLGQRLARRLSAPAVHGVDWLATSPDHASVGAVSMPAQPTAEAATAPALRATDVYKAFGGNEVLRGVDLELLHNRLTGLVGANGSGKTTFLNIVSGFVRRDSGTIEVSGRVVTGSAPHTVARSGLARSFQVPLLVPELSVRQNVEIGILASEKLALLGALLRLPGWRRRRTERAARAAQVCARLGLERVSERPVRSLSLGMRRLVEIARAVATEAPVLLLDEPASGLNPEEVEMLGVVLRRLREERSILLIEHNLPFVFATCDDVYLLELGRVVCHATLGDGTPLPQELLDYSEGDTTSEAAASPPPLGAASTPTATSAPMGVDLK
jgi:branched-chain amino acid transport system permease protein